MKKKNTSRIPAFYKYSFEERLKIVSKKTILSHTEAKKIGSNEGLTINQATHMIENVIGTYNLPLAIATNFQVNNRDYLIPMVIEESSVIAAVSNAAKLFRNSGGFHTSSDTPIMIGQIQVLDLQDISIAQKEIIKNRKTLIEKANEVGGNIVKRGGGARNIIVREFPETTIGPMLVVHLLYDTRDAMGANAINTAIEHIAPEIEAITNGRVNLRILSNLSDQRKAYAKGKVVSSDLQRDNMSKDDVVKAILEAAAFAEIDPYRAATHNKGIMNGIDAVALATGNDWRAIEAGAHAYAARSGSYRSLTKWWQDDEGNLCGSIEIPMAVGIVGGATRVHPTAQAALHILGVESAQELAEIMAAVGLAQNFAAMRALVTDGIQKGHMRMHARQLAIAAGASTEIASRVVQQMQDEGNIRLERAKELVNEIQGNQND